MTHFTTLAEYCAGIGIGPPQWEDFDVRSFADNMKTVRHQMPPFKHEFYALAIKLEGGGAAQTGNFSTADKKASLFFNSPYQIIRWDIAPDWTGYYAIFTEDFLRGGACRTEKRITETFPFLLIDQALPLDVTDEEAQLFIKIFRDLQAEHRLNDASSPEIIRAYLRAALLKALRHYQRLPPTGAITTDQRGLDLAVVSRFRTLLELHFRPGQEYEGGQPHQVQFYAGQLNLHPNHFNAVVKRITDRPASEIIYHYVLQLAKSKLKNSDDSVKEIAYQLYYNYPNHFTNFFKKRTGVTPSQYRKQA